MSASDASGLRWWKSSRSGGEGGNCVEIATTWRKSSRSSGQGGECVEVADDGGQWFVRDSKNPDGAVLTVSGTAWRAFLGHVRAGA
jgi:uncharacterized protein DUF397